MSSHGANIVFLVVVFLWFLSEIIGGYIIPDLRRGKTKIKPISQDSQYLFRIGMVSGVVIGYIMSRLSIGILPDWFFVVGIVFMVTGIILRQLSIVVLGRFFSPILGTQEGQRVVSNGPYRYIRHPSYSGMYLIVLGLGFVFQSWVSFLVILVICGLSIGYRISAEEKMLISSLGQEYIDYMKKTKKIIPYII